MTACPTCGMPAHDGPCPYGRGATPAHNYVLQGRYELIGQLGQGGMGTVYMARDLRLHNRPCVVKKLRDDFYREEDKRKAVAFFERESGVLSRLQHPNIVHILDYFEENYDYFLVMEYVEGRDLHNILMDRGEPFTEQQVLDWAVQICDVLEYLHEHDPPVIYRDLKPSNVMIDVKGRVKLVDFGIARPCGDGVDNTHVVSAGYSPPEQYWGAADPRSDIYALGATMFFLLTGQEPVALHASSPKAMNDFVSERADLVVRRATAQDPEERYQSAREMREALAPAQPEIPPRSRTPLMLGGLALVAIAAGAIFVYSRFEEIMQHKTEQLEASAQVISKQEKEKTILTEKLKAYSRAVEAQERAILEWREQIVSVKQAKNKAEPASKASMAAQVAGEADLTDPEGLAPLEDEAPRQQTFSFPFFGDSR